MIDTPGGLLQRMGETTHGKLEMNRTARSNRYFGFGRFFFFRSVHPDV